MAQLLVPPVANWQTLWSLPDSEATHSILQMFQLDACCWHMHLQHTPTVTYRHVSTETSEFHCNYCHSDTHTPHVYTGKWSGRKLIEKTGRDFTD